MNLGDADHCTFERMGVAAGNRLKTVYHLRRGNDRIDREMRHRRMAPAAFDRDLENVKAAIIGPDRIANWPIGSSGQLCMP